MKKFKLQILTPKGEFYNDEAELFSVNTVAGRIQILTNHIPYVTGVKASDIKIRSGDKEKYGTVSEGILYFNKNDLVLLVDSAKWNDEKRNFKI